MKKIFLTICLLFTLLSHALSPVASVQIADATNYITVTQDGVVKWTIPKRETAIDVDGTALKLRYADKYVVSIEFSTVTSPSTANVEALRVAIKNMLINL